MVNIDTVYQRVLAIANKEQRGYITPLEFNLLANQAQLVVFEQYFYDRHKVAQIPGSKINHSDIDVMLDEKISLFERRDVPFAGFLPIEVSAKEWLYVQHSPLLQPKNNRPIYIRHQGNQIFAHGTNNEILITLACNYITQPIRVEWGYDVVGEKALYNASPNKTTHFLLHASEETELVMRILELAGVIMEDSNVVQYANKKVNEQTQAKK